MPLYLCPDRDAYPIDLFRKIRANRCSCVLRIVVIARFLDRIALSFSHLLSISISRRKAPGIPARTIRQRGLHAPLTQSIRSTLPLFCHRSTKIRSMGSLSPGQGRPTPERGTREGFLHMSLHDDKEARVVLNCYCRIGAHMR